MQVPTEDAGASRRRFDLQSGLEIEADGGGVSRNDVNGKNETIAQEMPKWGCF